MPGWRFRGCINIGAVIISEASLSFLGFGLSPEIPSWGTLLSRDGRKYMEQAPWLALWSGLCLTLTEAASLLQAYLPPSVSRELLWSSLEWQSVSFIDDRLRDSESDLLYAIRRTADGAAAWLYVLLEHQSTPDPWLRLRLLKYSIRIWERDRRRHPQEKQLRPIVPLVLYQGGRVWREAREFAELFAEAVRDWPGVPRYAHLLIDQTQVGPEELRGELLGRIVLPAR